ncbi:alpha/beta-hydrolase [Vararia minispora EC-137]|uniref:Alpha/beta-hydrolase n=1 Tax=Vararia minispora EC-137 TaxID=1314806 RepID=A0ACB8QK56_9AGAM|nr:alpha/beta-hydrolase [Vararia minispora EC-137]
MLHLGLSLAALASIVSGNLSDVIQAQHERTGEVLQLHDAATGVVSRGVYKRQDGSTISFANPAAEDFFVDGTTIPDVPFDAGPSWAGLMPISGSVNETRKLFFWFWPTSNASNANTLTFWTNGGPGCSSLEGFLQENGPISWSWGQAQPTPNPWSWTNLSNVVWVEQPVGTGFSQGTPNITNDDQLAAEVVGFMQQFLEVFSELKGSEFFVTGESYAGFYVPYIANFIYENSGSLELDLKGIWIADPSLSYDSVQEDIPALRFAQANKNVFPFSSRIMANLQNISDVCGFTDYLDRVTYPPTGQLPFPVGVNHTTGRTNSNCRIWNMIINQVSLLNPAFDVYRVTEQWPVPWSVLGFPRSTQEFIYFNRTDVQDAIHAPHITWSDCSEHNVYVGGDHSIPSTLSVLPNVIEKSERTVIVHGLADFILLAEGTRIAIQNMTWGGAQGFQTPIKDETFIVDDPIQGVQGVYGNMHQERNLTYVEFYFSGHMTPQFVPWAAFQTISYLLGKTPSPSA